MQTPQRHPSRRAGISLLVILFWLCAVAVVSLLAIPRFFDKPEVTLWHAVELMASDLRSTQNRAAFRRVEARFEFSPNGWRAVDAEGRPFSAVPGELPIERSFGGIFEGVAITRIDFGDDDSVVFDAQGRASEAGTVDVTFRGVTHTLELEAISGLSTIHGPDGVLHADDRRVLLDPAE